MCGNRVFSTFYRIIPKKHVFVRISTPQPGSLHQSLSESFSILDEGISNSGYWRQNDKSFSDNIYVNSSLEYILLVQVVVQIFSSLFVFFALF